jgi:hypothetical protein
MMAFLDAGWAENHLAYPHQEAISPDDNYRQYRCQEHDQKDE